MASGFASSIAAIIMSFITMITSLFNIIQSTPEIRIMQDFEPKTEIALRIMSFNIRCLNVGTATWQDRIGIVSETMLKSEADSIGIQEGTPEWMETLDETVAEKYAYVGVGRDDGANKGEYSAIFYLKDKYNLVDSGTFWLSETPEVPSKGWDASMNRICTWALLENKETGEKYLHMNSHFDHIGTKARANSAKLIVERAKDYTDIPVVFTADMNIREGTDSYNTMVESGYFFDTKKIAPDSMNFLTYHDTNPRSHEGEVIDYVMINDKFEALCYRVVTAGIDGQYVSDHFPVYADIVIK